MKPPRFLRPSVTVALVLAEAEEDGAPLLSGDVLDETGRYPANLSTIGYDVSPPDVQDTTRGRSER